MSQNVPTTAVAPAITVQTPPITAPHTPAVRSNGDQRAAAIKAQLNDMEATGETSPDRPAPKPKPAAAKAEHAPAEVAETAPPEPDADSERAAKESADRLARINVVREKDARRLEENERRRKSKQQSAPAPSNGEIEKLRQRVAELEPAAAAVSSPMALLAYAEKHKMSPQDVATALRQRLTDPNIVAEQQSKSLEEKLRAEIRAENDKLRADIKKLEERTAEEKRAAKAEAEGAARAGDFLSSAASAAESHPRTARLLKSKGAAQFINWVNTQVVAHLERGYSTNHLHDVTEQYLAWLHDAGESPNAANGASQPPKNGAAKPVTTLSNALTSGRNAVTEERPLHLLSKKEREAALRAKLERE